MLVGIDVDIIDELEGGEIFGAEFLGDVGAAFAFADVGVAGEGDDEDVALLFGELKIADVAGMDDVEAAVAVDDGFAGGAGGARCPRRTERSTTLRGVSGR